MSIARKILMGAAGAAGGSTFVDDVFSTYLYDGNATARSITTGIDMTKGGLTWIKDRSNSYNHVLQDTVRGAGATTKLASNDNWAQNASDNAIQWSGYISAFNNNGFSLDKYGTGSIDWANVNKSGDDYTSWNFRKQKGFFDVVTYSGNGSVRTISHSLGCVPALIMVKGYTNTNSWYVYHGDIGPEKYLRLNGTDSETDQDWFMNDTAPTADEFSLGASSNVNGSGQSYVAYLFAGVANYSVEFDGVGDFLTTGQGNMWTFGTNDFTVECWVKFDGTSGEQGVYQAGGTTSGYTTSNIGQTPTVAHTGSNWLVCGNGGSNFYTGGGARTANKWYHVAHVRNSGVTKLYVDGVEVISFSDTYNYQKNRAAIGVYFNTTKILVGNISNFRLVKNIAVYTSNFTPPTSPLTLITGTMLLCCNTGSITGFTKDDTGNGITFNGDPKQSADVPSSFIDSNLFGENEDQNIIRCGSYVGKGNASVEVDLGWEPQWVLVKNKTSSSQWVMFDSMRGVVSEGVDERLVADDNAAEGNFGANFLDFTSKGFIVKIQGNSEMNQTNNTHIFVAIRRSDGYVGKPAEAGTDVFAMDTGNSSSTIPTFDSGFPVDFLFQREPASGNHWRTSARLIGTNYMNADNTDTQTSQSNYVWDSNVGALANSSWGTSKQAWMWKRGAGFDVVAYEGTNSAGLQIAHSLNAVPEMIWTKNRDAGENWAVYHKGLNGGTNPEDYVIRLNTTPAEFNNNEFWNDTAPTSTHFTLGISGEVNGFEKSMIAMLFASVEGISKVGYYDGQAADLTITTGFSPRFLIVRRINGADNWWVFDTFRGWVAGNNSKLLQLDSSSSQSTQNFGEPTSTGFTLLGDTTRINSAGNKYIYYAHA